MNAKIRPFLIGLAALAVLLTSRPATADLKVRMVAPGVYFGEAPRTDCDYRELQALGIRTVVELRKFLPRKSEQEQSVAASYGMAHVLIPMGFRPTADCTPEEALAAMTDPSLMNVYVHCVLGRDRTGLVVALYRVRYLGWPAATAYEQMRAERFNPLLRDLDRYFWRYACGR